MFLPYFEIHFVFTFDENWAEYRDINSVPLLESSEAASANADNSELSVLMWILQDSGG